MTKKQPSKKPANKIVAAIGYDTKETSYGCWAIAVLPKRKIKKFFRSTKYSCGKEKAREQIKQWKQEARGYKPQQYENVYVDLPQLGDDWKNVANFKTVEAAVKWIRENIGHCDLKGNICLITLGAPVEDEPGRPAGCERCGKPATTETPEDETLCGDCGADREAEQIKETE